MHKRTISHMNFKHFELCHFQHFLCFKIRMLGDGAASALQCIHNPSCGFLSTVINIVHRTCNDRFKGPIKALQTSGC